MLRLANHRSHYRSNHPSRNHHSVATTLSADDSSFQSLRLRLREAAHQRDPEPLVALRQSTTYQECYAWGRRQAQTAHRYGSQSNAACARNAAAVQTVCYALDAFVGFCQHYEPQPHCPSPHAASASTELDSEFLKQIRPSHRNHLLSQLQGSFHANPAQRRAAMLSALDAKLVGKLAAAGIVSFADIQDEVAFFRGQCDPAHALSEAELLAVVDYLNSSTGTFNAINGAALASAYYGEHSLHARVGVFSTTLDRAIDKLCDHPFFARRDIVCYKGIRLNALDSPFRLMVLEDAYARSGSVAFPNVLSASCDPEQSYARKKYEEGYTLECLFTMRRGFYADPFHDTHTMGEHEILGPANQRFRVTGKSSFKVFDWRGETPQEMDVDRYEMTPYSA